MTALAGRVLADHGPNTVPVPEYLPGRLLRRRPLLGHFPEARGAGVSRGLQAVADRILRERRRTGAAGPQPDGLRHGRPDHSGTRPGRRPEEVVAAAVGHHGAHLVSLLPEQAEVRIWPGWPSAVAGGDSGGQQKVWTSLAHQAAWGLLLARTNPDVPKHRPALFVTSILADVEARPLHGR